MKRLSIFLLGLCLGIPSVFANFLIYHNASQQTLFVPPCGGAAMDTVTLQPGQTVMLNNPAMDRHNATCIARVSFANPANRYRAEDALVLGFRYFLNEYASSDPHCAFLGASRSLWGTCKISSYDYWGPDGTKDLVKLTEAAENAGLGASVLFLSGPLPDGSYDSENILNPGLSIPSKLRDTFQGSGSLLSNYAMFPVIIFNQRF